MSPCPHCGALALAEPSAFFRWRCAVCGGPVVASDEGSMAQPAPPLAPLVRAQRWRAMAFGWFAAAAVFAGIAALAGGLTVILWAVTRAATLAAFALGAVAGVAAALALVGRARGVRHSDQARAALVVAWQSAAGDGAAPPPAPPLDTLEPSS